jgi:hypothetical protein
MLIFTVKAGTLKIDHLYLNEKKHGPFETPYYYCREYNEMLINIRTVFIFLTKRGEYIYNIYSTKKGGDIYCIYDF